MNKVLDSDDLILINESLISDSDKAKNTNNSNITYNSTARAQATNIIDFDGLIKRAAEAAYRASLKTQPYYLSIENIYYNNLQISDVTATIADESEFMSNPKAIFMGANTFSNTTEGVQSYKTDIYIKKVSSKIISSVINGISVSAGAKFSIFNNVLTFNYNKTDTTTKEEIIEIKAPEQQVKLSPSTACKVSVFLGENSSEIILNLHARISGTFQCYVETGISSWFSIDMATALLFLPSLPSGIYVDKQSKQIIFNGLAVAKNVSQNNNFSVQIEKLPF